MRALTEQVEKLDMKKAMLEDEVQGLEERAAKALTVLQGPQVGPAPNSTAGVDPDDPRDVRVPADTAGSAGIPQAPAHGALGIEDSDGDSRSTSPREVDTAWENTMAPFVRGHSAFASGRSSPTGIFGSSPRPLNSTSAADSHQQSNTEGASGTCAAVQDDEPI